MCMMHVVMALVDRGDRTERERERERERYSSHRAHISMSLTMEVQGHPNQW
jgi:hypothetical protein